MKPSSLVDRCKAFFEIDKRGLAAFRIALASMLLFDLMIRFPDIGAFLTDDGVLPREAMLRSFPASSNFSIHLMTGSYGGQVFLFALHACLALLLLVGKHTRVAAAGCWLLLISLQSRNDLVLHGGDHYLRILFLWAIFLPLNGAWAIDKSGDRKKTVSSLATAVLLIQMGVVYWFAAALKTGDEWLKDYSALYYALSISYFKLPAGQWLLAYPDLLKFLTRASLLLEWVGPFLFFLPIRFTRTRSATFAAFFLFHLGIGATLYLGTLPYVFLIPLFVLLPPPVWNAVEPWCRARYRTVHAAVSPLLSLTPLVRAQAVRWVPTLLLATLGFYQLAENVESVTKQAHIPKSLRWVATTFRIDQDWGMFAPYPYKAHGWYVIEGSAADGSPVSFLGREPATSDESVRPSVPSLHRTGHWLSYSILAYTDHRDQLSNYADYLCRKGNESGRWPRLAEVRLSFMKMVTPPSADVMPPKRELLITQQCHSEAPNSVTR